MGSEHQSQLNPSRLALKSTNPRDFLPLPALRPCTGLGLGLILIHRAGVQEGRGGGALPRPTRCAPSAGPGRQPAVMPAAPPEGTPPERGRVTCVATEARQCKQREGQRGLPEEAPRGGSGGSSSAFLPAGLCWDRGPTGATREGVPASRSSERGIRVPGILGQNGPQRFRKKRQQEGWHGKERARAEARAGGTQTVTLPPTGQKGATSPRPTQWLPNLPSLKCPGSWLNSPIP